MSILPVRFRSVGGFATALAALLILARPTPLFAQDCARSFETSDGETGEYWVWRLATAGERQAHMAVFSGPAYGGMLKVTCWYISTEPYPNWWATISAYWVEDPDELDAAPERWLPGDYTGVRPGDAILYTRSMAYAILDYKYGTPQSPSALEAGLRLAEWAASRAPPLPEEDLTEYRVILSLDTYLSFAVRVQVEERSRPGEEWGPPSSTVFIAMYTDPAPPGVDGLNFLDAYDLNGEYRPSRVAIRPDRLGWTVVPLGGCNFGRLADGAPAWTFEGVDFINRRSCPLGRHMERLEEMVVAANATRAAYNPIDVVAQVEAVLYSVDAQENTIKILAGSPALTVAFDHIAEIVRVKGYRPAQSPEGVSVQRPGRGTIRHFERSEANGRDLPWIRRQKLLFGDLITMGSHDGVTIRYKLLPSLWELEAEPDALENVGQETVTVKIGVNKSSTDPVDSRTVGLVIDGYFSVAIEAFTRQWGLLGDAFGGMWLTSEVEERTEGLDPSGLMEWDAIEIYPNGTRIGLRDVGKGLELFMADGEARFRDALGNDLTMVAGQRSTLEQTGGFVPPEPFSTADLSAALQSALAGVAEAASAASEEGDRDEGGGGIPVPGAEVVALNFFESGAQSAPSPEERTRGSEFAASSARFIYWSLTIDYPFLLGEAVAFPIEAAWLRADGTVLATQTWQAEASAGYNSSGHLLGWGWAQPGNWQPGQYTVRLSVGGQEIAVGGFTISER